MNIKQTVIVLRIPAKPVTHSGSCRSLIPVMPVGGGTGFTFAVFAVCRQACHSKVATIFVSI